MSFTIEIGLGTDYDMLYLDDVSNAVEAHFPGATAVVIYLDDDETEIRTYDDDNPQDCIDAAFCSEVDQRVREIISELWVKAGIWRYQAERDFTPADFQAMDDYSTKLVEAMLTEMAQLTPDEVKARVAELDPAMNAPIKRKK